MKVYQAINAVQAALAQTGIAKDRTNTQGASYKFRGIDDVYNAVAPLLAKHSLCVLPRVLARECVERQSKNGGALFYVTVEAEFDFVSAEDGSKHTVKTFGEAMDSGDKATNKAMSAAYKYAAFQAFAIPTEGDNDADAHTHEVETRDPLASFKPPQQKLIRAAVEAALQAFAEGKEYGAYEEVTSCLDKVSQGDLDTENRVRMAIWSILNPHPALRSAIKRLDAEARSKQKEAA